MPYAPRPGSQAETLVNAIRQAGCIRSDALARLTGIPNNSHHSLLEAAVKAGAVMHCLVTGGDGRSQREYRIGSGLPPITERAPLKAAKPAIVPVREVAAPRKPHASKPSAASVKANRVKALATPDPLPRSVDLIPAAPDTHISGAAVVHLPADPLTYHVHALQAELDEDQKIVITHDSLAVIALGHHFRINPDVPGGLNQVLDAVDVLRRAAA